MKAMPNFEEVAQTENNDDAAESETQKGATVQTLELTESEVENYTAYEAMVDTGRFASALLKETGDERYDEIVQWAIDKKESLRKKCKEQDGNLPMFRAAFPVEDRSDEVWVLPAAEAAEVGIDYEKEDYIALPVYNGKKWDPREVVEDFAHKERKPKTDAEKKVVKCLDENPGLDAAEIAELCDSSDGWVENFAKKFRPDHVAANGVSEEQDDEPEATNKFVEACQNAGMDPSVVDAATEGYGVPSEYTVEELKDVINVFEKHGDIGALKTLWKLEMFNKNRKTALRAIEAALDRVENVDDENAADDEVAEAVETVEDSNTDDEVEKAKVEALKALTETLNAVNDTLNSL